VLGQTKKNYGGNSQVCDFAAFFDDLIDRLLVDAGHGADFGANVFTWASEHWINKSGRSETRLANQSSQRLGAAKASRPVYGKRHACLAAEIRR
jgi:hypothetical protein